MAIARITTWAASQVLTASALNSEFDNILNNALALVSPLTGALDFNAFKLTNLSLGTVGGPGLSFNADSNTGVYSSAADTVDISAGGVRAASFATVAVGVNYHNFTPSITTSPVIYAPAGSDANIGLTINTKGTGDLLLRTAGAGNVLLSPNGTTMLTTTGTTSVDMGTNKPFIPATVSGTPAQHGLFRENVVKGWINFNGTGVISTNDSFNVTSITDEGGSGDYTVTWDRDFANTGYAVGGAAIETGGKAINVSINATGSLAVGTSRIQCRGDDNVTADPTIVTLIAIGDQ